MLWDLRYSRRKDDEADPLLARLADAGQRGEVVSLEELELQQPFNERVVVPFIEKVGELSTRFTPQRFLEETTRKLELAGNPGTIDAATFLATRFVGAFVFGGLLLLVSIFAVHGRLAGHSCGWIVHSAWFFLPAVVLAKQD